MQNVFLRSAQINLTQAFSSDQWASQPLEQLFYFVVKERPNLPITNYYYYESLIIVTYYSTSFYWNGMFTFNVPMSFCFFRFYVMYCQFQNR